MPSGQMLEDQRHYHFLRKIIGLDRAKGSAVRKKSKQKKEKHAKREFQLVKRMYKSVGRTIRAMLLILLFAAGLD